MNNRYNMNRSERRKKKIKREVIAEVENEGMPNFIKISIIVILLFFIFYALTVMITGGIDKKQAANDSKNEDKTPTTIQYEEILAGETFNVKNNEYYVMFYSFEDKSSALYNALITNYKTKNVNAKIYKVNLDKGFNSIYVSDVGNPNATSVDELKINGPTLIKISNGKNVSYSEGKDAINATLK
jgi:flagellar basal body-associated protein FliL